MPDSAQNSGPTPQDVPSDWPLIPSDLNVGDSFRFLFVTSGTRNAESSNINDYNLFVQNAANGDGVDDTIKGFHSEFRAVASTTWRRRPGQHGHDRGRGSHLLAEW